MNLIIIIAAVIGASIARAETKDWEQSLDLLVNRCFKTKNISVLCEEGFLDEKFKPTFKEIHLTAKDANGQKFFYGYGRALDGSVCDLHIKQIKRLMSGTDQACITGDSEFDSGPRETAAKWVSFETKHGQTHRND